MTSGSTPPQISGANSRSSSGIRPVGGPNSPVLVSGKSGSGVTPVSPSKSTSGRKGNVTADREKLGLTSLKPSEMIKGLDEAVKRAEKLEAREEAKRKGGGHTINKALHVDDTGSKWARMVYIGMAVTVMLIAGGAGVLFYLEKRQAHSPREMQDMTHDMLLDLETAGSKMKPFGASENVTAEAVKSRILDTVKADLAEIQKQIDKEHGVGADGVAKNKFASIDRRTLVTKERLAKLINMKDAWGGNFVFTMTGDTLKITTPNATNLSVSFGVRAAKAASKDH